MVVEAIKYLLLFLLTLLGLYMTAKVITMGIMKGYHESQERRSCNGVEKKEENNNEG